MKPRTVLIAKLWTGWYGHVALYYINWLLIWGIILAAVGIVLSYMENLAEIRSR